jgi:hypothetical protein
VPAIVWGRLAVTGSGVSLDAAPFAGSWGWHAGPGLLPAAVAGLAIAWWGPRVAARCPARALPAVTAAAATAWTAALAAADGWDRVTAPLASRHDYEPFAATLATPGDIAAFLRDQAGDLASYPVHVQGHPPGPVVVAWLLDRVGLGGAGWLAALALVGWGVAVAAALVAVRSLAGDHHARRAAPALAVLPAAVWAGTSLDALFAGVAACGCALAVLATTRSSVRTGLAAGAALGAALLLSYGAALVLAVPAAAVGVCRRRGRSVAAVVAAASLGAAGVLGVAALTGSWWPAGLAATRDVYWTGIGGRRPGWYTTLAGNPGALALAAGPAVAAGLAAALAAARAAAVRAGGPPGRREAGPQVARGLPQEWALPVAALAAVALADLSQLTRGEVERIWLPFVPWLALAAPGHRRGWLAAQVAVALVLQAALRSPW